MSKSPSKTEEKKEQVPPPPADEHEADAASSTGSEGEQEEEVDFHFADDTAADAVRAEAVKLYNTGDYGAALDQQYRVVRYFTEKYGATAARSAKYFLDYALSQLRVLQSQSSLEDVLQPRDEEAMETCFINLEIARVGLQKKESEIDNDVASAEYVETELMLAEVHNALAQLFVEKEDFDAALKEYEAELLLYRSLQEEAKEADEEHGGSTAATIVPAGRLISALYGIADCFAKEGDFAGAEERLQATLDEIAKYPAGTIQQELIDELSDLLEDAKEMKGGKFEEIQKEIDAQFVAQEAEKVPTAEEFYDGKSPTVMGNNGEQKANPYVSSVPGATTGGGGSGKHHGEGSHLSMPLSAQGAVLGFGAPLHGGGGANNENSNSVSFFPAQQLSRSGPPTSLGARVASRENSNAGVNTAVVRKKAKVPMGSPSVSNSAAPPTEPDLKKSRTE